jgi:ubiquinone/menaquinone biosynthesis C-methylase UbiE
VKLLEANKISNVELQGTDSSSRMLLLAEERLNNYNNQLLTVQFTSDNESLNSDTYDIITASLVLPYSLDKAGLLRELFRQLKPKGLLITSHWSHPSQVSVLTVLKRINHFMATGERIDISHLESDASFSCWQEEATKQMLTTEGFTIEQWIPVNLSMSFPDIRTLLSFCRIAPWFNNDTLYSEAEKETKRILCEDYNLKFDLDGLFELPNTVIVIVASKQ